MTAAVLALLVSVPAPVIWLLTALHVLVCLVLILIVQMQRGRSGDLASAFGGGGPTQVNMAAMSSEDFLTKGTKWLAAAFMVTSLVLGLFSTGGQQGTAVDLIEDEPAATAPATPEAGTAPDASAPSATTPTPETPVTDQGAGAIDATPVEATAPDAAVPSDATAPADGAAEPAPDATAPTGTP